MKSITHPTKLIAAFALTALTAAVISPFWASAAHAVVVSGETSAGNNQPGWLFNRDLTTQSPYEFNTDQAQIGNGSLYVLPIQNNINPIDGNKDKFIAEYFPEERLAVADLDTFSYDFYIGAGGAVSDANEFYLNVYANFGQSADTKFYDCRYNVVPTTGSTTDWTTVTFDPTQVYPVTTSGSSPYTCPPVPADMDLASSTAEQSNIRVFALNLGDTSGNDQGLDGYFDNVAVTIDGEEDLFDFDPFVRSAEITAPTAGEEVSGVVDFAAMLVDQDMDDNVQWAVRFESCNTNNVAGNVGGFSDPFAWDNETFTASVDMTAMTPGEYCFVFNPTESAGDTAIRLTQNFTLVPVVVEPTDPTDKNQCKKGGYADFGFKNQGQCVRFVETGKDSR